MYQKLKWAKKFKSFNLSHEKMSLESKAQIFNSFLHGFYICYLAATQPIVSHCQGVNLANLMLLTEVCQTKDHLGCYIKFGSSLLSASQKGFGINRSGGEGGRGGKHIQ